MAAPSRPQSSGVAVLADRMSCSGRPRNPASGSGSKRETPGPALGRAARSPAHARAVERQPRWRRALRAAPGQFRPGCEAATGHRRTPGAPRCRAPSAVHRPPEAFAACPDPGPAALRLGSGRAHPLTRAPHRLVEASALPSRNARRARPGALERPRVTSGSSNRPRHAPMRRRRNCRSVAPAPGHPAPINPSANRALRQSPGPHRRRPHPASPREIRAGIPSSSGRRGSARWPAVQPRPTCR